MLLHSVRELAKNKPLIWGLAALIIGQLLWFVGHGALFVIALIFVLVIGLPYPPVLRSLVARGVVAFLLAMSFLQVAAVVQFFVLPETGFKTLGLITLLLVLVSVVIMHKHTAKAALVIVDKKDTGAFLTAAFFAVPLAIFAFWGGTPERQVVFGGLQSPDGSAHNVAFDEAYGKQHLTYRSNPVYYPKGFHIANGFVMEAFGLHKKENTWQANAAIFVGQYITWGAVVAFLLFYLARQLLDKLAKQPSSALLACVLGPPLSLLYLLPFAHHGFLNFYYIVAAFLCGLLLLQGFALRSPKEQWWVLGYCLLAFGVTMSWGPLLLPIVVATPVLYILFALKKPKDLWHKKYLILLAGLALLLPPLYLHFAYSTSNVFNAYGSIRVFNYGVLIAGIIIVALVAVSSRLPKYVKDFAVNAVMPMWILVGGLVAAQYFLVGEPRYYSIKTSYLLELVLLALAAAFIVFVVTRSPLHKLQQWFVAPVVFASIIFLLISANGNPLEHIKNIFGRPMHFATDVQKITKLGLDGQLRVSNNVILHYIPGENKVIGNVYITNWANGLSPINESNAEAAECSSKIFSLLAYGNGSKQEQEQLVRAVKQCINQRVVNQGRPYYIITDPESAVHLKRILGDKPTFL